MQSIGHKHRAIKWTYDVAKEQWDRESVRVSMSRAPFEEGGMRLCYRAHEHARNGDIFECVVKVFKPECEAADHEYFDEAMTQMIADSYAQDFNRKSKHKVAFLPVSVLQLQDGELSGSKLLALEPYMRGDYVKHNDNAGAVQTNEATPQDEHFRDSHVELSNSSFDKRANRGMRWQECHNSLISDGDLWTAVQAFSHWTYETSGGELVCCDIQGVGEFFTDPQIHSKDGEGFGSGNMGEEGVQRFLRTHACTSECEALGLTPLRPGETDEQLARRLQEGERMNRQPPKLAVAAPSGGGGGRRCSSDSSSSDDDVGHYIRRMRSGVGAKQITSQRYKTSLDDAIRMLRLNH